jgi:hypothetical protein
MCPAQSFWSSADPARSQGTVPVRLRILNTFDHRHISVRGRDVPLAWNTTSAVECNLENHYVRKNGLIGLLRPDKRSEDSGLFGINAFDPKKIPVIFVHGLKSSPAIWKNALNDIYNDPELCARYQPLLFMYPSGLPVPRFSSSPAREHPRVSRPMGSTPRIPRIRTNGACWSQHGRAP